MIIGVIGTLGAGKTLLMVLLAFLQLLRGREVYSNFSMKGAKDIDKITDIRTLFNCVILIDDIIPWLDSRQSQSNVFITHLLMASRKKKIDILYSSQINTGGDIRLRVISDTIIYPFEIEFPVFGIDIWIGFKEDQGSEFVGSFDLEFSPNVYNMYDTLEVVYQKIEYSDIIKLYNDTNNSSLFSLLLNIRYNIMKVNGRDIYTLINLRIDVKLKVLYLEEILQKEGYVLIT